MTITNALLEDYQLIDEKAVWFDVSNRTRLTLTDQARVRFLHNLCSNQINSLKTGQGCEAFITSIQGKILGHVVVLIQEDQIVLETAPDQAETLLTHLGKYALIEDVELLDNTPNSCELLVVGNKAAELLSEFAQTQLPQHTGHHWTLADGPSQVTIFKSPLAGNSCWAMIAPIESKEFLLSWLKARIKESKQQELLNVVRIEAGFPEYSIDLTENNLAQEANRDDQAISFTKGCYLGQEPIARIDAMGHVNKKLSLIQFEDDKEVPVDGVIIVDDKEIASISSAAYSPQREKYLALAQLKSPWHDQKDSFDSHQGAITVIQPIR